METDSGRGPRPAPNQVTGGLLEVPPQPLGRRSPSRDGASEQDSHGSGADPHNPQGPRSMALPGQLPPCTDLQEVVCLAFETVIFLPRAQPSVLHTGHPESLPFRCCDTPTALPPRLWPPHLLSVLGPLARLPAGEALSLAHSQPRVWLPEPK